MPEAINPEIHVPVEPSDIPGLVSFWRFDRSAETYTASQGERYTLRSHAGAFPVYTDATTPFGSAITVAEGQWMSIPRAECPRLDFHGPHGALSVVAWVRRGRTQSDHCEFIAGQWNESGLSRQYGLFINIRVWQEGHQVCGHLSNVGGPTPGFRYCVDGAMGATPVPFDEWVVVAMSYDGVAGRAWLDGRLDARDELNPYPFAGGLHDGGSHGSDFTVGAVDRSGTIGNFFCGALAGLAVYDRALGPAEMRALARIGKPA